MTRIPNLKKSLALSSLIFLFTACGGGGGSSSESTTVSNYNEAALSISGEKTPTNPTIASQDSKVEHKGKVKDSITGEGLSNVKVSIGSHVALSDENGNYTFTNLTENEETVINFEKKGYLLGSKKIQVKELSQDDTASINYLEYALNVNNFESDYDSNDEVNGAHIMIDASVAYKTANGELYTGINTAELTYFDITSAKGKAAFPGAFEGKTTNGLIVQFETYGIVSLLLKDTNGNKLSLAENETITLGFDAVDSLEKPDTLPLWYYNYDQGLWVEEGYAQLQDNGTYQGEVAHLGTWSVNKILEDEPGIYRGHIVNEDGSPMTEVRIQAIGENWISSDLSTDEDGLFEIEVIPGKSFQLAAYDYKLKFGANYNGIIEAIASGDVFEE